MGKHAVVRYGKILGYSDGSKLESSVERQKVKPTYRRIKPEALLEMVRKYLLEELEPIPHIGLFRVTKEELATRFQVRPHQIAQIIHILNQEGVISQAQREYAHDTDRNPLFFGSRSGWHANVYRVNREVDHQELCGPGR